MSIGATLHQPVAIHPTTTNLDVGFMHPTDRSPPRTMLATGLSSRDLIHDHEIVAGDIGGGSGVVMAGYPCWTTVSDGVRSWSPAW